MSRTLRCVHCFYELDPRDKFCSTCSAEVSMTCAACGVVTPYAALYCPSCGSEMGAEVQAERRQVSIMYCDLVRSTEMSFRLDPEDMREVIQSFQDNCEQIIRAAGGYVSRYVGDSIQAYFGYPHADENAVESSVRCALQLCESVAQIDNPLGGKLSVRVGLATGVVVVGDVIGKGFARQFHAVGGAANLAARIQEVALPGMVTIAEGTRRLIGQQFVLKDLGQHQLKGCIEPQSVWAVLGLAPSYSRFTKIRQPGEITLMCRQREAHVLSGLQGLAWGQANGQVALISGDAGMGKSHLAAWLATQVSSLAHIRLHYQCTQFHQGSSLYPFINQIRHAAGLKESDAHALQFAKLEAWLDRTGVDGVALAPLYAALLSIPVSGHHAILGVSSDEQRQQTFIALLEQLGSLAGRCPVLIIFEDVQWADATSIALLSQALNCIRTLPVMVVLTCRPGFDADWVTQDHVHLLKLERLDPKQAGAMVTQLAAPKLLENALIEGVVQRSDGVPLYVEELTKAVVCAGEYDLLLRRVTVPESLRDTLVARLDRVPALKEVAQICAAIGRDISFDLLRAVTMRDDDVLKDALSQLEAADLLHLEPGYTRLTYRFRHALVQEAAYDTLLVSRRQAIHLQIAETLQTGFPSIAQTEPELLAQHFTLAGALASAISWWQRAGSWAVKRSAYLEAAAHFTQALELAQKLPADSESRLKLLDLNIAFGQVMLAMHGFAATETVQVFKKARQLAAEIEDISQRCAVYYALWAGSHVRAELAPMREMADAFMLDVANRPDSHEADTAHRISGVTKAFEGQFEEAKRHLLQAMVNYDPQRDRPMAYRFGQDNAVAVLGNLALVHWALGEIEQAHQVSSASMESALQSDHAPTMAYGHTYRCFFAAVRDDAASSLNNAEALAELSKKNNLHWWAAAGLFYRGLARWHTGQTEEGESEMRRGLVLCREHGLDAAPCHYEMLMADVESSTQRERQALARLTHILTRIALTGEHWLEAEVHYRRAILLARLQPDEPVLAERALKQAISVAGGQRARTFELRAALRLADLPGNGSAALESIYAQFSEPVNLPEWREAGLRLYKSR